MLARWLSVLRNYDFEVQHRHGALHNNADGLSRIPSRKCKRDDCEECRLRQSDCVCVVTRGQANKQRVTQECRDSEDGVSQRRSCIESADGSSVPCRESTHGNVNSGSNSASGGRVDRSDKTGFSIASRGFSVGPRFPDSNWVDIWSLDELENFQCQDKDISEVLKLKSAGGEKPQKTELSDQSQLFKYLCARWSVLKVDGGLLVREWVLRILAVVLRISMSFH